MLLILLSSMRNSKSAPLSHVMKQANPLSPKCLNLPSPLTRLVAFLARRISTWPNSAMMISRWWGSISRIVNMKAPGLRSVSKRCQACARATRIAWTPVSTWVRGPAQPSAVRLHHNLRLTAWRRRNTKSSWLNSLSRRRRSALMNWRKLGRFSNFNPWITSCKPTSKMLKSQLQALTKKSRKPNKRSHAQKSRLLSRKSCSRTRSKSVSKVSLTSRKEMIQWRNSWRI